METVSEETQAKAIKAVKLYNRLILSIYDNYVFKIVSPLFFKCPQNELVDFYRENISRNHLEIGVGTGFLLKKSAEVAGFDSLSLLDLSENCLNLTAKKLKVFKPEKYHANILERFPIHNKVFDSVGLSFVLHCVPGSFKTKGIAFDHIAAHMQKGGKLFGTTAIYYPEQTAMAKYVMDIYNKRGMFNNTEDKKEDLVNALANNYTDVVVEQMGNVLFFTARKA
jgi:ubiquinone/menaquinone biosynthesis C-methylase UbiE